MVVVRSFSSGPFRAERGDWTLVFSAQSDCDDIILCLLLSLFMFLLRLFLLYIQMLHPHSFLCLPLRMRALYATYTALS